MKEKNWKWWPQKVNERTLRTWNGSQKINGIGGRYMNWKQEQYTAGWNHSSLLCNKWSSMKAKSTTTGLICPHFLPQIDFAAFWPDLKQLRWRGQKEHDFKFCLALSLLKRVDSMAVSTNTSQVPEPKRASTWLAQLAWRPAWDWHRLIWD